MRLSHPNHPVWKLSRVLVLCCVLLTLQLITATNYDLSLNGEAGTLAGVVLIQTLMEWIRK
jgi:hypothetical protein